MGGNCVEERVSENKAWAGQVHPWVLPLPHPGYSETLSRWVMTKTPGAVGGSFWWTDEEGVREK